tara:strand:+ start:2909 stop:3394 length:486 start_codon:yes stop_codon:yes gene_type:complete
MNPYMSKIIAENDRLKKENKKLRKISNVPESFVDVHLSEFKSFLSSKGLVFGKESFNKRYFYQRSRKGRIEDAMKINVFITDLLEAKVRLNSSLQPSEYNNRLSMDIGSLIKHLQKDRTIRPRTSKKTVPLPPEPQGLQDNGAKQNPDSLLQGYAPPKSFS